MLLSEIVFQLQVSIQPTVLKLKEQELLLWCMEVDVVGIWHLRDKYFSVQLMCVCVQVKVDPRGQMLLFLGISGSLVLVKNLR